MSKSCHPGRRVVARGHVCMVEECECGTVHVTIGVLTLRLDIEVVASIWETLGEALRRMRGDHPPALMSADALPTEREALVDDVVRKQGRWVS